MADLSGRRRVRWWPWIAILSVAAAAIVVVQLRSEGDQQLANMLSMAIGVVAGLLSLVWLVAFSRLAARARLVGLAASLALVALFFVGFRVRGTTGDLIPIFEWRWAGAELAVPAVDGGAAQLEPVAGLADFSQFCGPMRDGRLPGPKLARDWKASPPKLMWRRDVGAAWSGFAVAGRRAITMEQRGDDETTVCYDVVTGDVLWLHTDKTRYFTTLGGLGPRSTPTIAGGHVFAQGATGILNCLDLATGKLVWSTNVLTANNATLPEYGVACSPLVTDKLVVISVGGKPRRSLVAHDRKTGTFVWGGGTDSAQWSSPVRAKIGGVDQVLIFNAHAVTAHALASGTVLWTYPWKADHPHVSMPVVLDGGRVFVSSGYGTGCELVQVTKTGGAWTATRVWRSLRLKAKFTNVVAHGACFYGLDDGTLACIDAATGRRHWKGGRYGHGQILVVGDLILVMGERGDVVLVEAMPDAHHELSRVSVFDRKTWNPPALAGAFLLVRNDKEAACYRLETSND